MSRFHFRRRSRPNVVALVNDDKHTKWAREIRKGLDEERERKRKSRMTYRLRRQLAPWKAAAGLLLFVAVFWSAHAGADAATTVTIGGLIATGIRAKFARGSVAPMWQGRLTAAGVAGSIWAGAAIAAGPSLGAVMWLSVITVALSLRWWRHHRIGYPTGPVEVAETVDQSIPGRWARYIGGTGGLLAGSWLGDQTATRNGRQWTVNLAPGQHTLKTALSGMPRIASGVMTPMTRVLVEKHPSRLENQLVLTIVDNSPIEDTVAYPGPVVEDGKVVLGPYADGDGMASWRFWTPGEKPNDGSGWGGLIIGGTGAGKSRLIEEISIGAMSTGQVLVWFIDPQGGASSPALMDHADWYGEADDAAEMLAAIERVAARRAQQNSRRRWTGFDPSPERPFILVLIDEAHMLLGNRRYTKRFEELTRMTRKVGIGFVALSQYPGLTTFGNSEPMRASVMKGNGVIMHAPSRQNKDLMPGVVVDPMTLPDDLAGFGYTVGGGGRTAPFRAYYVADPEVWMAKYTQPKLEPRAAQAAGYFYTHRREIAKQKAADDLQAELDADAAYAAPDPAQEPAEDPFRDPNFPRWSGTPQLPPVPAQPQLTGAQARVWDALGREVRRSAELLDTTGWSDTRLNNVLNQMIKAGLVVRVGNRGRYRRATGAPR
jgi:hypothetical protein